MCRSVNSTELESKDKSKRKLFSSFKVQVNVFVPRFSKLSFLSVSRRVSLFPKKMCESLDYFRFLADE